jgi:PAS domain S-box-containing protein
MNVILSLDAIYEAAFITDGDFRITDCNTRAVEVMRSGSRERLIGRYFSDIPTDCVLGADFPTYFRERLTAVPFVVTEQRITRDDGNTFWAETVAHRLSESAHIITIRDVTARVESFQRAEEANERLRAAIRDRMEFVSNVSHELRTPLTSMSYALTNMLRGICGTFPEKAVGYLERLQIDVKRLLTTVNDLLDLRQMENGTLSLRCTTVPLGQLLSEAVAALQIQAEVKQQTLRIIPFTKERYVYADKHKLERVFFNVLSNAIKYTPEQGTITARIYEKHSLVTVEVDDNGIGIPQKALSRVSQRYFRVGEHVSGTGLGLSIVREITELHKGLFEVESPVPSTTNGTRITIRLPTTRAPQTVLVSTAPDFITRITQALEPIGHELQIYPITKTLPETLAENPVPPARIIFDGDLSEAQITDAVCRIRRLPSLAQVPILVLISSMEPLMRREYAKWRVDIRPQALSTTDLCALVRG